MNTGKLLHGELSATIARMGHGDALVIGDAGLPIPHGPLRIDLAVTRGAPSFLVTLDAVLDELRIERIGSGRPRSSISCSSPRRFS